MFRRFAIVALCLTPTLLRAEPPAAATPVVFKWQQDQVLTYKVLQRAVIRETALDDKDGKPVTTTASTNVTILKKWHVKEVDSSGTATLELVISELRNESVKPDGKSVIVDSKNPEDALQMAAFLNVPILTARIDARGRIAEVKEAKGSSEERLQAELPFRMILPETGPSTGQTWDRSFSFKLSPPLGTGETHGFLQKFTCSSIKDGLIAMKVETSLKAPPQALAERVPLVPMLWSGEVYFNPTAGKLHAARLKVKAELTNYQGEGTKFEYESSYAEDAVEK